MYDKNDPERVKEGKRTNYYNWKCYEDCYNKDCSITKIKSNTHNNTAKLNDDTTVIENTANPEDDTTVIENKATPKDDTTVIENTAEPQDEKDKTRIDCNKYKKQINSLTINNKKLSDNRDELKNKLEQSKITLR